VKKKKRRSASIRTLFLHAHKLGCPTPVAGLQLSINDIYRRTQLQEIYEEDLRDTGALSRFRCAGDFAIETAWSDD
jgi:hypothetical protein